MHQNRWRLGRSPKPRWGSLQRSPRPPSCQRGRGRGRKGEGRRGEGRGGEGRGRAPQKLTLCTITQTVTLANVFHNKLGQFIFGQNIARVEVYQKKITFLFHTFPSPSPSSDFSALNLGLRPRIGLCPQFSGASCPRFGLRPQFTP